MLCQKIKITKKDKTREMVAIAFYTVRARGGDLDDLKKETGMSKKTNKRHLDQLRLSSTELGGRVSPIDKYHEINSQVNKLQLV